jgi:hypothetical protein
MTSRQLKGFRSNSMLEFSCINSLLTASTASCSKANLTTDSSIEPAGSSASKCGGSIRAEREISNRLIGASRGLCFEGHHEAEAHVAQNTNRPKFGPHPDTAAMFHQAAHRGGVRRIKAFARQRKKKSRGCDRVAFTLAGAAYNLVASSGQLVTKVPA